MRAAAAALRLGPPEEGSILSVHRPGRPGHEWPAHAALIAFAANRLAALGATRVFADIPHHRPPATLAGLGAYPNARPDATGRLPDQRLVIVEVETCGSIDDPHTTDQWRLFRARADAGGAVFVLVVPARCGEREGPALAQARAEALGIHFDEIWTPQQGEPHGSHAHSH
ncbi:MAG: hypothetical protein HY660_17110 [Armatimonadetes bacterium]|nr:hypothetical protein [Armatimonadota bacterium]